MMPLPFTKFGETKLVTLKVAYFDNKGRGKWMTDADKWDGHFDVTCLIESKNDLYWLNNFRDVYVRVVTQDDWEMGRLM